ncbi:hypothetical protein AA310_00105 [Arthrobacter sp. YC-RL1]|uniref:hypothetical protein n=1 Tax=Arthrobacter sp. YC-RL1 TaxID=1652545 RepID=UPI00063DBFD5|nr:hypothetical protein [Arthrobacter sp. YC-RL1]KLI90703.1 hypothetical protein AA310_00105 [Arthrobacter sp. YC-RL1]
MTKELNVNEVVERARRAQESRLAVIKGLAEAQQNVANVRADAAERIAKIEQETNALIAAAEREHVSEFQGAQRAGWSTDELKGLGFTEPDKSARTRKRAARKPTSKPVQRTSGSSHSETTEVPAE